MMVSSNASGLMRRMLNEARRRPCAWVEVAGMAGARETRDGGATLEQPRWVQALLLPVLRAHRVPPRRG
eukprot:266799-Prymnesium_polylepis.3